MNNAAYQRHREAISEITEEQWDRTFRTNIYGYFHMVKAALAHMKKGAAIINTGSITGLEGSKHLLDYAATKQFTPLLSPLHKTWWKKELALTASLPVQSGHH